jgi:HAD superfamily hydrolase (TIGR01490 family)
MVSKALITGKPKRSLAFFDIDGTLTDGFTILSFAEFLNKKGCFHPSYLSLLQQDRAAYQGSKRAEQDYYEFAVKLVDHYAQGLKDQQAERIQSLSYSFLESALQNQLADYRIHGFAQALVKMINPIATTIAVSGSPREALFPLTAYLGFQELHSTLIEIAQGRYTGRVDKNLAIGESKKQLVDSYLAGEINLETSFAFGDSVQDIPMLEVVGNAFVMGGNPELQNIGGQRGWAVISARDDIVDIVKHRITLLFGV